MAYFTKQTMIKFVAFQLLDNPPAAEKDEDVYEGEDEDTV